MRGNTLQMGHATAEAVVRAGLQLVPVSFTGASEAVAVGNVGVSGIPVELVHPAERQSAMESMKAQYPGLVLIDFTLPSVVNGEQQGVARVLLRHPQISNRSKGSARCCGECPRRNKTGCWCRQCGFLRTQWHPLCGGHYWRK